MNINADRYASPWQSSQEKDYYKGYAKKQEVAQKAGDEKKPQTDGASKDESEKTCREQILEKMEEMAKKVKDGTVEPTFQIGAMSFTLKEWDKLLEKFDAAEEALQEAVQAQIEEAEKQAAMEALRREAEGKKGMQGEATVVVTKTAAEPAAESVAGRAQHEGAAQSSVNGVQSETRTEDMDAEQTAALLTDEVTKCGYPTDDPKQKHWFITAYGQEGISCKEAYFDGTKWVNKDCFSLPFTEEGQYEKVMAFLKRFPADGNLRFAAHENFWKDFLAGEIDEDDFVAFFETTKDGVPDYTYTEGDSTYIDREKVKYAKYMNDFGAWFYTAEEMELIQRAVIHENQKGLKRLDDYDGAMTIPGGGRSRANAREEEIETQIVTKPDGTAVLKITTPDGETEIAVSQAQKWGLQIR